MHVAKADVPILVCIDDMNVIEVYLNNLENKLVCSASVTTAAIERKHRHPFLVLPASSSTVFTTVELKRLHRRFRKQSHDKLANQPERANVEYVSYESRKHSARLNNSTWLANALHSLHTV